MRTLLKCLLQLYQSSSSQYTAEALIKKCDHQLYEDHYDRYISVKLCVIWLVYPVPNPVGQNERQLQTQHITYGKVRMFYPTAAFFLVHILFYAFPHLHLSFAFIDFPLRYFLYLSERVSGFLFHYNRENCSV